MPSWVSLFLRNQSTTRERQAGRPNATAVRSAGIMEVAALLQTQPHILLAQPRRSDVELTFEPVDHVGAIGEAAL